MRIGVVLKTLSASSWGTGIESFEADIITAKINVNGKVAPIIPSTGFRGVLRTEAFRVARLLMEKGLYKGLPEPCRGINPQLMKHFSTKPCGECAVCIAFGSPGRYPSPVKNTFLIAVKDADQRSVFYDETFRVGNLDYMKLQDGIITEMTFIALDDSANVAKKGALYVAEIVPPQTYFYGEIELKESLLDLHLKERKYGEDAKITVYKLLMTSLRSLDYADAGRGGIIGLEKMFIELNKSIDVFEKDDFLKKILKWEKIEVVE